MRKIIVKNNIQTSFSIYVSIVPAIFLITMLFSSRLQSLVPVMIGFMISYIITVLFSIRYFGFLSLYNIFLYTSAFFVYDGFLFTILGLENFLYDDFPVKHTFDEDIGFAFIIVCFVTVYVMHISYCIVDKSKYKRNHVLPININLNKMGKFLMIVFFFPVIAKLLIQFNYIRSHGYIALYRGELAELKYPFWTAGSFIFFTCGYCLFLASNPKKREYLFYTLLCGLVYFANSLKGQRGGFLSIIIYFVYYYTKHYNVKITLKKILVLLVFGVSFIVIMGNVRSSYGDNNKSSQNKALREIIEHTIYVQSRSRAVPMYIIQGDLEYHKFPFVLSSLLNPLLRIIYPSESGQTKTVAEHYNKMSAVVTYNLSKQSYLNGKGLGSAFIAEAYDFYGYIGLILFSILLARFFVFCDFTNLNFKRKFVPLLFFVLQGIPILPRSHIFRFIDNDFTKIIFAYVFLIICMNSKYIFKIQNGK